MGFLPATPTAWDTSFLLDDHGFIGGFLNGLIGYRSRPSVLEAGSYVLYLAVAGFLLFRSDSSSPRSDAPKGRILAHAVYRPRTRHAALTSSDHAPPSCRLQTASRDDLKPQRGGSMVAQSIDRRAFLAGASATAAAVAAAPLIKPLRAVAAGERSGRRRGAVGHRDAVRMALQPIREDPVGLRLRSVDHARSQDLRVSSGARHRMEALEQAAGRGPSSCARACSSTRASAR